MKESVATTQDLEHKQHVPLLAFTDLMGSATMGWGDECHLADVFALYLKAENFHWHRLKPRGAPGREFACLWPTEAAYFHNMAAVRGPKRTPKRTP
jgi:hypothetical protein